MSARHPPQIDVDPSGRAIYDPDRTRRDERHDHGDARGTTGGEDGRYRSGDPFAGWSFKTHPALHQPALFRDVRGRRVMAFLIDLLVMGVFVGVFGTLAILLGILSLGLLWPIVSLPIVAVPFVYVGLMAASRRRGTFGMQWLGLEVRAADGRRPHLLQTLAWWGVYLMTVPTTWGLALLIGLFNDRGRLIHDALCGLTVVDTRAADAAPDLPAP